MFTTIVLTVSAVSLIGAVGLLVEGLLSEKRNAAGEVASSLSSCEPQQS